MGLLAIAAVVVGAVLVVRPTTSLGVLALLIGAGLVLGGLLELLLPSARARRSTLLLATALIITGVVVLVLPGLTVRALAVIVGVTLIVRGAAACISAAHDSGDVLDQRIANALFGAAGIAFGALAIVWPDVTLLVVAATFGAALAAVGVFALIRMLRNGRSGDRDVHPSRRHEGIGRRWLRTIGAVCVIALAAGAVVVSVALRGGAPVVDDFYVAPRTVPSEPGELIRAESFTRGIPDGSIGWRILYTTTRGDGAPRVASALVVVPDDDVAHPAIAWHHGTTGYGRRCAPSLASEPFESGAMFALPEIIEQGWALVATDYIGLGTEGPHPYLIGADSARAELDAVRAARRLDGARLSRDTVAWGHSQGGGAALWTAVIADDYAPDVPLAGAVALAPASDLVALVGRLPEVAGGSVFASFVISAYSEIYPDVSFSRYVRPGAEVTVRAMAQRCLASPDMLVSVLSVLALTEDPRIVAQDPATGPLGRRLEENTPSAASGTPVLLGQGDADSLIDPVMQAAYAERLCASGGDVDYRSYEGREHVTLVAADSPAIADALAWTSDRLDGTPAPHGCR